jgi:hypothetical protein
MRQLVVDGELSGTGVRDTEDGFLNLREELGLSTSLSGEIERWQCEYEEEHFDRYKDRMKCKSLDREGVLLARRLKSEKPDDHVRYYSSAYLRYIDIGAFPDL